MTLRLVAQCGCDTCGLRSLETTFFSHVNVCDFFVDAAGGFLCSPPLCDPLPKAGLVCASWGVSGSWPWCPKMTCRFCCETTECRSAHRDLLAKDVVPHSVRKSPSYRPPTPATEVTWLSFQRLAPERKLPGSSPGWPTGGNAKSSRGERARHPALVRSQIYPPSSTSAVGPGGAFNLQTADLTTTPPPPPSPRPLRAVWQAVGRRVMPPPAGPLGSSVTRRAGRDSLGPG